MGGAGLIHARALSSANRRGSSPIRALIPVRGRLRRTLRGPLTTVRAWVHLPQSSNTPFVGQTASKSCPTHAPRGVHRLTGLDGPRRIGDTRSVHGLVAALAAKYDIHRAVDELLHRVATARAEHDRRRRVEVVVVPTGTALAVLIVAELLGFGR
jgi:hypothetical protein